MTAELLTKELDRAAGGKGTTRAGAAATVAGLSAGGLPVGKTKLIDGSGLDSGNRTTCNLLHAALLAGGVHGPIGDGLAVAGRSGTLNDKMTSTAAEGRLRAKTGAIYGVIGLVGYVDAPAQNPTSTPPVSFAFVLNGVPDEIKRGIIRDRLGETLALFPAGFSAATIEPLPPVIPTPPKGTKPTAKTTTTTKPAGPTTTTSASP